MDECRLSGPTHTGHAGQHIQRDLDINLLQVVLRCTNHAQNPEQPFFAYIAPKAVHEPFIPAPWYLDTWPVESPQNTPEH